MEISIDHWKHLHETVYDQRVQGFDDEASDVVISTLSDAGLQLDPEGSDDDPVLAAQAAMEIGYLLACREHNLAPVAV
jgi:hypothetical protein